MRQRDLASLDTLSRVANDLAGEFRLEPLLELILRSSVTLLGCESGSLCLVEPHTHTYRKQIDMQAGCQAGRAFPLEEGVTGAVARAGRPVTFRHYADVPGGHVSADSPLYNRAVIGVPIRLRSDLLGSLVVFAPDDEYCFGDADAQLLQRFATHAAIAMANARLHAEAADRAKAAAVWAERERSMLDVHDALGRGLATVLLELAHAEELAGGGWPASVTGQSPSVAPRTSRAFPARAPPSQCISRSCRGGWRRDPPRVGGRPSRGARRAPRAARRGGRSRGGGRRGRARRGVRRRGCGTSRRRPG